MVTKMRSSSSYKSLCLALFTGSLVAVTGYGCSNDSLQKFDTNNGSSISTDGGVDASASATCAESGQKAKTLPLDIVFLLDRSLYMKGDKWNAASHALLDFISRGFPAPTQVALTLVPYTAPEDVWGDQTGANIDFCQYRVYQNFVVPMADVSVQRAPVESAIANALLSAGFGYGRTSPIYASLQGTYFAATKAQAENPDHQVVVVYVGNGAPLPCNEYGSNTTNSAAIAALADSALRYNGVRTFAVALDDQNFGLMSEIAKAGGGAAFKPSNTTSAGMLDAMLEVTKGALDCAYALPVAPAGRTLDPSTLSVEITSATGDRSVIPAVTQPACDAAGGWFYDNAAKPTKVIFCPQTCNTLRDTISPRVELVVGCNSTVF
ncbi:VWA domain-containing protein [Labilithrix luteola]|nr:vWA domain-containing protein [Labilithrix luteola]